MSHAYFADPDEHGVPAPPSRPALPTLTDRILDVLPEAEPGMTAPAVCRMLDTPDMATVARTLLRLYLDGRAARTRTSPQHLWRYWEAG